MSIERSPPRLLLISSCLLAALGGILPQGGAGASPPLPLEKSALEAELAIAVRDREEYYLTIDGWNQIGRLKSGGRILREFALTASWAGGGGAKTTVHALTLRVDPGTLEHGSEGLRLRDRPLPADFTGRLVDGPRSHSRLLFNPPLLIQAMTLPVPPHIPTITLPASDVKALGSALKPGSRLILVPPSPPGVRH